MQIKNLFKNKRYAYEMFPELREHHAFYSLIKSQECGRFWIGSCSWSSKFFLNATKLLHRCLTFQSLNISKVFIFWKSYGTTFLNIFCEGEMLPNSNKLQFLSKCVLVKHSQSFSSNRGLRTSLERVKDFNKLYTKISPCRDLSV